MALTPQVSGRRDSHSMESEETTRNGQHPCPGVALVPAHCCLQMCKTSTAHQPFVFIAPPHTQRGAGDLYQLQNLPAMTHSCLEWKKTRRRDIHGDDDKAWDEAFDEGMRGSIRSARVLYMEKYQMPASSLKRFSWGKKTCGGWRG